MPFNPKFEITARIARALMEIERSREAVEHLPITPSVLLSLRETARLHSTHYSTMIEGNRLTREQVANVIQTQEHFAGRERDEQEVLGYYAAFGRVEAHASIKKPVTENEIQILHALVMGGGKKKTTPSPYRDGQNVIRDGRNHAMVYLPPEAKDVPRLMKELVAWCVETETVDLPCPLRAGIAHYQFATIHPYYDGNGRTARLLTTMLLHLGGYGLKGLYSLEEYYARNLGAYYEALTIGPSHNYYEGRDDADITKWVEYFSVGMVDSFEKVRMRAEEAAGTGAEDLSRVLRGLDPRQRKALGLFKKSQKVTSVDVEKLFGISQRAARDILKNWAQTGFVKMMDPSKKSRRYVLAEEFEQLLR